MSASALLQALAARVPVTKPVALVAAHPDDETIGAGASLRLFRRLLLVHVTDGAPRDLRDARASGFDQASAYAAARRCELWSALQQGEVAFTGVELAELGALDQQASLHMLELAEILASLLTSFNPICVITHGYEGGHPDHDTACLITHLACSRLKQGTGLLEMTSYHAGSDGALVTGVFLDDRALPTIALSEAEQARKRAMLACFATQRATLAPFGVTHEAFRPAPTYDFAAPPHRGTLYYEQYDWGMTGARWRSLAQEALAAWRSG